MFPDLGKYEFYVLGAYGATAVLLVGLIWFSLAQSRRIKAQLAALEARQTGPNT